VKLPRAGRGRPRRYCSAACRQSAYRKRCTKKVNPLLLLRQDLLQMMQTERLKSASREECGKLGLRFT
jgi:hypothetical protein